jgi:hypothetical protein
MFDISTTSTPASANHNGVRGYSYEHPIITIPTLGNSVSFTISNDFQNITKTDNSGSVTYTYDTAIDADTIILNNLS